MPPINLVFDVAALKATVFADGPKGFVCVVDDISSFVVRVLSSGVASQLAAKDFSWFSLAGAAAEAAHDALDRVLEVAGFGEVITTFHEDDSADEMAAFIEMIAKANGLVQIVVLCISGSAYEKSLIRHLEFPRQTEH